LDFKAEDPETWLPLVRDVVGRTFAGGFPIYVERDEIEQECLIRIPAIIASYANRNGASFETFVRTAVRNDARDYLRKKHREHHNHKPVAMRWELDGVIDEESPIAGPSADSLIETSFDRRRWITRKVCEDIEDSDLDAARSTLTPDQFRVYVCRYLLGMPQAEAGDYLQITREAVASRERKVIANLAKAGLPVPNRIA